jgi:tetratricopeptide (TPR) repeat protein
MKITICNLPVWNWSVVRVVQGIVWILTVVATITIAGCTDQKQQAENLVRAAIEHSDADHHADAVQCLDRAIALNPGLAEAFYLRGTCNTRLNRPQRAAEDLSAATRLKPGWDEAWCSLGIAQLSSGDTASGITSLSKALQLNANLLAAWEARARGYRELHRAEEELHDLGEVLRIEPAEVAALQRRATLLAEMSPEKAAEDLSRVISLERDNATAWMERGLCYNRMGDTDRALADLNLACRLRPDDYRPWFERGRILRTLLRADDAVSDLSKAAELAPGEFRVRRELGRAYLDHSNVAAAESNLLLAERVSPNDPELQLALAQTDIAQGRRENAVARLRELLTGIDTLPASLASNARISLAQLLQESDNPEEAMVCVEQVLETEPTDTAALRIRAALLANSNRREEAIEDYTRLISANTALKPAAVEQSVLERGRLHLEGEDWSAAIADFSKYLEDHPDHVETLTLRARAWLAQKEAAQAISDLTLALLKQPDAVELYLLRAAAFDQIDEPTAALADLQKAAHLPPEDSALMQKVAERLYLDHQYVKAARILDVLAESSAGPLSAAQRLLRGRARLAAGNTDGAWEDASAISAATPDAGLDTATAPADAVSATDVMLLQSMIALRRGDDAEALRLIKNVPETSLPSETLFQYGQALVRQNRTDEALHVFSHLLKSDASNTMVRLARAAVYRDTADWQAALDDAVRVLEILPDDPRALQIKSLSLFQNDRFAEALDTLDHPALLSRDTIDSRWMRILCCSRQDLTFRQLEELNALLGIVPNHEAGRLLRAEILEKLGHFDDAIADLSVALEQNPGNLSVIKNRALLNQRRGNAAAAVADFSKAIELSPDDADLYYRRGIARHQAGQTDDARKDLDKAIDLNTGFADAWYVIGNLEAGRGQTEAATAAYAKAVEIQPEHAAAWYNRGNLLFNQGKLQQAVDCWTIAITIQPDLFRAWNNRAAAYDRMDRDAEAVADYEKTLQLNPVFVRAWDNLAWLLATSSHKKVRDPERSIKLATKACELSEFKDWNCLNTLATCCAENQDFTAAVKWAKQARTLAPESDRQELDQLVIAYEAHLKAKSVAGKQNEDRGILRQ